MLVAAPSRASNENLRREVAVWSDVPCMLVVDRSVTPIVHFEYAVSDEDAPAMLTADEVADSRRLQFFAFSRQLLEFDRMQYITWADIERAAMVDPQVKPDEIDPEFVLETTSRWGAADWVRITADDMRVPITDEQAAMGLDWDVSAVTPGTWIVKSFTWEPTLNAWSDRWGGVKVIASADEHEAAGPGAVLLLSTSEVEVGEAYVPPGCIDAPDGSTLRLEYGLAQGSLQPEWTIASDDVLVATGPLDVEFVPSEAAIGGVYFRATVTDPDGRTYVAYSPRPITVAQASDSPTGSSGDDSNSSADSDDQSEEDDGPRQGCGCATGRGVTAWSLLAIMACLRRRARGATLRA